MIGITNQCRHGSEKATNRRAVATERKSEKAMLRTSERCQPDEAVLPVTGRGRPGSPLAGSS
ncbi:MAG TPA: hypothetical protein VG457_13775, partial [Planctomycetota bacterium]|nr:hypothetical protein [Planctomycetota bacterium]